MADKLVICVSQHQALFDKQHANYKDKDLKDNLQQSTADQLGLVNGDKRQLMQFNSGWGNIS